MAEQPARSREAMIQRVLDLQANLSEFTKRCDAQRMENKSLQEENEELRQYIDQVLGYVNNAQQQAAAGGQDVSHLMQQAQPGATQ